VAFALHFRRKVTQIIQNVSPRFDFLREKISTTALRRFFASRRWRKPMMMGGSCEWIGCHPQNIKTMRQFNLLVLGILGTFVNSFKIRMLL